MLQNKENIIVPKVLIDGLTATDIPIYRLGWVFNWLAKNPDKTEELAEILRRLDKTGINRFSHVLSLRHPQGKPKDPIVCATRTLERRKIENRIVKLHELFQKGKQKKLILANGLKCILKSDGERYCWFAMFNYAKTQVRLDLGLRQIISLEDSATKNVGILKRINPQRIQYLKDRKWNDLDKRCYRAAMIAIAEKTPIEIAALLVKTR